MSEEEDGKGTREKKYPCIYFGNGAATRLTLYFTMIAFSIIMSVSPFPPGIVTTWHIVVVIVV